MVKISSPKALQNIGVDRDGKPVRMTREAYNFIEQVWRRLGGDTDSVAAASEDAAAAAADAAAAAASTHYAIGDPGFINVRSDPTGVFPAGNPTYDLTLRFYNPAGTEIGNRVMRGTLSTAAGTFTVSEVSDTGSTTYVTSGDGTDSVRVDITIQTSATTQLTSSLSWNAIDVSSSGATPSAGGSK